MRGLANLVSGIVLMALLSVACGQVRGAAVISLAGPWQFELGGPRSSDSPGALPKLNLDDTIDLPGTTESQKKGPTNGPGWNGQLTRLYRFDGSAWYQRDVDIPADWRGKRVVLFLERTKYTQVWVDGKSVGQGTIFCTPQEFVLGPLEPGKHRITLVVDNTRLPLQTEAHQWSDNTQTNWNGIIGRIELQATDHTWIDDVQAYPNVAERAVTIRIHISSDSSGLGTIHAAVNGPGVKGAARDAEVSWSKTGGSVEMKVPLGETAGLWDEFHPNVMELTVGMWSDGIADERKTTFGLRDFTSNGPQFKINGRTTFLRGKHNACVFPLTGYPPMDVAGWLKYLAICKEYGINQIRCHTFVPPDAAFSAADELGMYLQPELPFWGDFDESVKQALEPEAARILKCYGNHPSFVMFTMGNENRGSRAVIASLVEELRAMDGRHLYAQGSNAFAWDPILPASDDFLITQRARKSPGAAAMAVRSSFADVDAGDGHVQSGPANTTNDYSEAIAGFARPVVGHEVGQYTIYPNFKEIEKYTGVTRAMNFEHFRDRLKSAGMLDQAEDFFRASGALAAICYREEIEAALRTPNFGGFQLLDLQDFPGQGTALVGILDAFMDSKGIITPQKWRQFCGPVVLLARFEKYSWTTDETFSADVELAHYGEKDLSGAAVVWQLNTESGQIISSGKLSPVDVRQGGVRPLGKISIPLSTVAAPARVNLELSLEGTEIKTSYPMWVYPSALDISVPANVTLARAMDSDALAALAGGGRMLLVQDGKRPLVHTVGGGFATDFWCWPMFHNSPGTMGLLCDPANPVLAGFPTEFYSDWQWFQIARRSQPVILDAFPAGYRPNVQVIDNLERVHRLGLVFEVRVGSGKLLVCASDLIGMKNDPAARQLLGCLIKYAASDRFDPMTEVTPRNLRELLMSRIPMDGVASASSFDGGWQNYRPARAADGNDYTQWTAADRSPDQWWQFQFNSPQTLSGFEILFGDDQPGYGYVLEVSSDGVTWQMASDQSKNHLNGGRQRLELNKKGVRFARITVKSLPDGARAAIREVWFY